jgi:hypothetical protein
MATPTALTTSLRYVAWTLTNSISSVLSTFLAPILLVWLPQGNELLDIVTDDQVTGFWQRGTAVLHYVLFLVSLLAWAFANWYGSRLLMQFDFRNPIPAGSPGHDFIAGWNTWLPRVLGIIGPAAISGYVLIGNGQWVAGGIAAVAVALFATFVIQRRRIFNLDSATNSSRTELAKGDRIAIWLACACSLVMFLAMSQVNYSFARTLGAPVILFMGLASIVICTSALLSYLPQSHGWPNLSLLPVLAGVVLGGTPLTHNHDVTPRIMPYAAAGNDARPPVKEHFLRWKQAHDAVAPGGPIFLVAAEGGASRSAWWTAHVLAALDYASHGEFSRHVYAVSGVSGGSVGAATYVGLLAERAAEPPQFSRQLEFPRAEQCRDMRRNRAAYPTPMQAECFLGEDFLSTTLGYLIYPDLLQRFFPHPMYTWDRSLGLEQTWQIDWLYLFGLRPDARRQPAALGTFGETLDDMYRSHADARGPRIDIPLLFLNSTRAQLGRAALQSPVAIESEELDDVFDARLQTRGLPLSAVVHNSARFPLVSPGGEVQTREGAHWDTLVDGGYYENSGAATLVEMIRRLRTDGALPASDLARIRVIFIMNDPQNVTSVFAPPAQPGAPLPSLPSIAQEEVLTPLLGLFNTRSARADASKRALVSLLPDAGKVTTEIFLGKALGDMRGPTSHGHVHDPSMSWYLNPASRQRMWSALGGPHTADALCEVLRSVGTTDCSKLREFQRTPSEGP